MEDVNLPKTRPLEDLDGVGTVDSFGRSFAGRAGLARSIVV